MNSWVRDPPYLVCELDEVQCMVEALTSIRWKRQQDAIVRLSRYGFVFTVEESGRLQASVCLHCNFFRRYVFNTHGDLRFGISLGLFVDSLNTFSAMGKSSYIEIRYTGPDIRLLLKSTGSLDACMYTKITTKTPDTIPWDCKPEPIGSTLDYFIVKSTALKEAIDDLEWPRSSIQINLEPGPPCDVTFKGEGHGDLQINVTKALLEVKCDFKISYRYKYKFLRSTTSNIPSSVLKCDVGSKVAIGRGGILKVMHTVYGYQQPSRKALIQFFVQPEEDDYRIS